MIVERIFFWVVLTFLFLAYIKLESELNNSKEIIDLSISVMKKVSDKVVENSSRIDNMLTGQEQGR